jgi:hypothetical protein
LVDVTKMNDRGSCYVLAFVDNPEETRISWKLTALLSVAVRVVPLLICVVKYILLAVNTLMVCYCESTEARFDL